MLKQAIQGVLFILGIVLIAAMFFGGMKWFSRNLENFFQLKIAEEKNKLLAEIAVTKAEQPPPDINVLAAISLQTDLKGKSKIIYEKNAETKLPIASLTKLMTAEVVLSNFDLSAKIKISKEAEKQDARLFLKEGESFIAKDLVYAMLIESNNSAAYAFAEAMGYDNFIKAMNLKAGEIGLQNTYFSNPTGSADTNYSTAKDLAILGEYILKQDGLILQASSLKEFDLFDSSKKFHHKVLNLNELINDKDLGSRILGGKTGNTDLAGQCLIVMLRSKTDENTYLVNVVLKAGDRFAEMKKLINYDDLNF